MSNSFQESVEYLLSLGNEVLAMKLGLENVRKLLRALGDPQTNYLKVQVAGTNGKGSVCAFLNSILTTAGIGVGMFTSPHLISITERVQINGVEISEDDFARLATRVRETSEELVASGELEIVPTFFEQVTAIALLAFTEAKVEIAILETGLGGRLDATTAANAEICAITRIDIDHQQYLGETLAEIAAEKAAIIREGSRVVIGKQYPEAMKVILDRCLAMNVEPLIAKGGKPSGSEGKLNAACGMRDRESATRPVGLPVSLGLLGRHQVENARTAVAVAELLKEHFTITDEHLASGLSSARHPGRLESIGRFLLDGAHNIGGARALREFLDGFVRGPITIVFGSMNDKDIGHIAQVLFPKADKLILTQPDNPRALPVTELGSYAPHGGANLFLVDTVEAAITKALEVSGEANTILVTGSLYLVGEARRILMQKLSPKTEK